MTNEELYMLSPVEEIMVKLIQRSPIIFKNGAAVLHHIFLTNGNALGWSVNGEIIGLDLERAPSEIEPLQDDPSPLEINSRLRDQFARDNARTLVHEKDNLYSLIKQLEQVYVGHTVLERAPANINPDWFRELMKVFDEIETFIRVEPNRTYYPYQYDRAVKLVDSIKAAPIYSLIQAAHDRRTFAIQKVLDRLREERENRNAN